MFHNANFVLVFIQNLEGLFIYMWICFFLRNMRIAHAATNYNSASINGEKKNILNTICLNLLVMLTEANLKGLQDFQHYSSTISSLKLRNDIAIPSVVINRFRATFVQGAKQHLRSEPPQKELFICNLKFLYQAKAQHRVDIFILST